MRTSRHRPFQAPSLSPAMLSSALFAAMLFLASACSHEPFSSRHDDGVRAIQPGFLPVPAGMRILERYHESHSLRIGSYQFADLAYEGADAVPAVASYVLDRFSTERFELADRQTFGQDKEKLRFQRGRYTVDCTIERLDYKTKLTYRVRTAIADIGASTSKPAQANHPAEHEQK